ncbi:HNH endonuclease [Sporosarcina ureae]|uniref:HNH endonuclease n=1 Tax=Sporosarcina ureae TaxID=1571 RepID=UPI0026EBDEB6|nr:HNH endonuclease signature motif containing protein [Sporosarcina ureae]
MKKICKACGITKSVNEFEKRKDSRDGYRQQCKVCKKSHSTYSKAKWAEDDHISFWRVRSYSLNNAKGRRTGIAAEVIINSEPISGVELKLLYDTDPCCHYCKIPLKRENIVFDHMQPLSREGRHEINNIAISCSDCNNLKGIRDMKEFHEFLLDYVSRFSN